MNAVQDSFCLVLCAQLHLHLITQEVLPPDALERFDSWYNRVIAAACQTPNICLCWQVMYAY